MVPKIYTLNNIVIKAPASEVFKYLADLHYHYLWNPNLRDIVNPRILSLGDTYQTKTIIFNKNVIESSNVIYQFKTNKIIAMENKLGLVKYKCIFTLNEDKGTTKVTTRIDIITETKLFGLTATVLKRLANNELQSDLAALKIAVENKLHY